MRTLLFTAGFLLCGLGFLAFRSSGDPMLLQGGLTLGGGWIICGLFSLRAKWHGIIGAGILAFLGGIRSLPAATDAGDPAAPFSAGAAALCMTVFIAAARSLLAERRRRSIEELKAGNDGASDR